MEKLRICTVGTSGTGKSTLSRMLAEELGIAHIPEQARVVCEDLGIELRELRYRDTYLFQKKVLEYQIREEERFRNTGFIADRSVFDPLVYLMRFTEAPPLLVAEYKKLIFSYYKNNPYHHIFYLRPGEFEPEDDGVRSTDRLYRYQVDGMFLMFLKTFSIEVETITGSKENRLMKALQSIENKRQKLEKSGLFENVETRRQIINHEHIPVFNSEN
ncbi:MAG: ATP-binding protein [Candidatus Zixiibacteriota bacterium]